jgi:hypothetical protein
MKTFMFETDAPNMMDPFLRDLGIKFKRDRSGKADESKYQYLIDLEPMSPHIVTLSETTELVEINQIPAVFKKRLLGENEP